LGGSLTQSVDALQDSSKDVSQDASALQDSSKDASQKLPFEKSCVASCETSYEVSRI
jgi:hypothetical protein